jgi:hypothetical protein
VEGHVRQGFVFLINRERVLLETTELCQLKIAGVLKVPPSQVTFRIEASKGKPLPIFEVTNPPPDLEPELVRETMATIYANLKLEMAQRFEGLGERRAG